MKLTPPSRWPPYALRAVLLGAALWLAIAAVTALALWHEREQAIDYAKRSAAGTVALMEQHTATTFQAVTFALEETAQLVNSGRFERDDPRLRETMRGYLRDLPYVRAIYVIDESGTIVQDTDFPNTPKVSLADRDYFRAHQGDPARTGMIASPLLSRSGTGWFVPVTRRVSDDGTFKGIVVAAIQLRYFNDLYQRMGLGEGQRILLYHRDGTLVAQYPPDDSRIGRKFLEVPLFREHLPVARRGVYEAGGPPVSYDRIFAYAALESQPLVVGVSYVMDNVLESWRRALQVAVLGLALALLLVGGAVMQYVSHETQRQRIRERLQQGEKLEALGQLTGGIAHDFGNVLGIVSNNVELLDRLLADRKEPAVDKALASARRAVATGTRLTRDLLGFARKRDLHVVTADLGNVLAKVGPMLRHAAGEGIQMEVSAEGSCPCMVDVSQLEVALINLVVNARDAMGGKGHIRVRVTPHAQPPAAPPERANLAYSCISVQDTGPGMSEDVRKRALEPFFTTKGEQGTGLGLAQVYGFVQQVGGELAIDSWPGLGTTVHLYFLAAAPE